LCLRCPDKETVVKNEKNETSFPLDEDLLEIVPKDCPWKVRVWQPDSTAIVVGRGNVAEKEVRLDACRADSIPVLRRSGGGGAVVLAPGCVVISFARTVDSSLKLGEHLLSSVSLTADAVWKTAGIRLKQKGIGDLCFGEKKVLGSSGNLRRSTYLYRASLLFSMDLKLIDRYLKHPTREPDYRKARPHGDFVTSLKNMGWEGNIASFIDSMKTHLATSLEGLA